MPTFPSLILWSHRWSFSGLSLAVYCGVRCAVCSSERRHAGWGCVTLVGAAAWHHHTQAGAHSPESTFCASGARRAGAANAKPGASADPLTMRRGGSCCTVLIRSRTLQTTATGQTCRVVWCGSTRPEPSRSQGAGADRVWNGHSRLGSGTTPGR
jgi:hypothetical protein